MKTLDQGQDKIKKICESLRTQTLEPAKIEAEKLISDAKAKAESIIADARLQSEKLLQDAHSSIERERSVFYSSLEQSEKQALDSLRVAIETKIFDEGLEQMVAEQTKKPDVIARMIDVLLTAIEKEGLSTDFSALIPKVVSAEEVNKSLISKTSQQLRKGPEAVGDFQGGVQLKLVDKQMTLDLSDAALCELLKTFMRREFRKYIFKSSHK